MTKPVNKDSKDNREYLPIGEEVLGVGITSPATFFCDKPAESMYFNELVYAVAFSNGSENKRKEVARSFKGGKINMLERDALYKILERIEVAYTYMERNGGKA